MSGALIESPAKDRWEQIHVLLGLISGGAGVAISALVLWLLK